MKPLLAALALVAALAQPPAARAADRLAVLLEWFVNPDHAALVIAREKGFFAAQGLAVELIPPTDPSAPPRLLAAGEADVAVHYQPNLLLDRENGLPLVRFGTLVETPLNTVMVRADGPIASLADLKGKRVGFSVAGVESAVLAGMLRSAGLELGDVEMVNVNFALTASLLAGRVDATIGGYRNFEFTQMRLEGAEGRAFFPEEHGVPAYDELILVAREADIDDPRLPRFLDAIEEATLFLTNHPAEAERIFLQAYPDLDDELNRTAFRETLLRLAKRPGALDRARHERFSRFMAEQELIAAPPAVETYAREIAR